MNIRRFTARNSRDALTMVRQALGEDAVVLSTRPGAEGVEVLAMAPEGLRQIEQAARHAPVTRAEGMMPDGGAAEAPRAHTPRTALPGPAATSSRAGRQEDFVAEAIAGERQVRREPVFDPPAREPAVDVDRDVEQLSMSTLSFQDYVRERMLKRRQTEMGAAPAPRAAEPVAPVPDIATAMKPPRARREPPVLRDEVAPADTQAAARDTALQMQRERHELLDELRSMKGLIEERFGVLAFMEKLQREPRQATLAQKLLDAGFSPALIRKLVQGLPADGGDESAWAAGVLERNLLTDEHEEPLEDEGGVFALIGATGVGKTTSTAKIAAAFATKHGAGQLGLITLDAYRVAAHEQLRTYGRILGVPVHTAHDRASLEDLLDLLSAKKMVLIDTAGMAQRDSRTRELLDMLSHRAIHKLLVVNAAAQGETIEDVMQSYRAQSCRGAIVSKLDEAVKLAPALDALIRHRVKVVGVANGQRVPEDWHRLSAQALVQRALRGGGAPSWRLDAGDVNLVFAATSMRATAGAAAVA